MSAGRIRDIANIERLGHVEFRTTDLERARDFYVDLIGLHETERDHDRIYLRCTEDKQHHTFVLRKAPSAGGAELRARLIETKDPPSRTTVGVAHLARAGLKIEIDMIAVVKDAV